MAQPITSGTFNFQPDVAEMVSEAWERLGFEPETLKARHAKSSRRSLNFMFAFWASLGFKQNWMTTQSITLTQGQINVIPSSPMIDVFHVYLTRSGLDVEMYPISNSEYEAIPNKTQQGRPTMYWVDYEAVLQNTQPTVKIWQASQNSTDIINLRGFNRAQDTGQANAGLFIPYVWYEACAAGLSASLAKKWRIDRYPMLMSEAYGSRWESNDFNGGAYGVAMRSTREKSPTHFRARFRM